MPTYTPTSVIALDKDSGGNPLYYAVSQGSYTREWLRYFSTQAIAFGTARISGIDNGPGINQYTFEILVTNWPTTSLPYVLGANLSWQTQKTNLENSFKKVATGLYFLDCFGNAPNLDPTTGVYFWKFSETVLPQSTPSLPFISYSVTLTQTPPGIIV